MNLTMKSRKIEKKNFVPFMLMPFGSGEVEWLLLIDVYFHSYTSPFFTLLFLVLVVRLDVTKHLSSLLWNRHLYQTVFRR